MKQIIFIFMAILLATGMVYAQNNKEKGKAVISAEKTSHDFGTIKETDNKECGRSTIGFNSCYCVLWLYYARMDQRANCSGEDR